MNCHEREICEAIRDMTWPVMDMTLNGYSFGQWNHGRRRLVLLTKPYCLSSILAGRLHRYFRKQERETRACDRAVGVLSGCERIRAHPAMTSEEIFQARSTVHMVLIKTLRSPLKKPPRSNNFIRAFLIIPSPPASSPYH